LFEVLLGSLPLVLVARSFKGCVHFLVDVVDHILGNISSFLNKGFLEFQQLLHPMSLDLNITLNG
jgi:hypothetical protein